MPGFPTYDFFIYDATDPTKQLNWDTSALTTSTLRTLKVQGFPGAITVQTLPALQLPNVFTDNNAFNLGAAFTNLSGATTPVTIDTATNATNAVDVITANGIDSSGLNGSGIGVAGGWMDVNGFVVADNFFLADFTDPTKVLAHDISAIPTGATRYRRHLNTSGSAVIVGSLTTDSARLSIADLTAQTADIASTKLVDAGAAGFYRVSYVLADTTSDAAAGSVTLTISWTDDVGATTSTATQALTGTGRQSGTVPLYLASGNITYAVTHTGSYGTAQYALRIRCEYLG